MTMLTDRRGLPLRGKLLILPPECQIQEIDNSEYDYDVILVLGNNRTIDFGLSKCATIIVAGSTGVVINIVRGMGSGLSKVIFNPGTNYTLNRGILKVIDKEAQMFNDESDKINLNEIGDFDEIEIAL